MSFKERKHIEKLRLKRRKMLVWEIRSMQYESAREYVSKRYPSSLPYFERYWKTDYRRSGSLRLLKRMSAKAVRKCAELPDGCLYKRVVGRWIVVD